MTDRPAVSPTAECPLVVVIDDAQMKEYRVTFTISMNTILPQFSVKEASVTRTHVDFEWLHKMISEHPKYSGLVIPPLPPKPDFTVNRDAVSGNLEEDDPDTEEYAKIKAELEREFIALFKKALCMHERFLQKIANISVMRTDQSYMEFLTSSDQLNSQISTGGFLMDIFRVAKKSVTDTLSISMSSVQEPDRFFDEESRYRTNYISTLSRVVSTADTMTVQYKRIANHYIKLYLQLMNSANCESTKMNSTYENLSVYFDKIRKIEARVAADEDLKLADTLRMDLWNNEACRDLLVRRTKALITSDNSHKALLKGKQSNQNVAILDDQYQNNVKRFEAISESAKAELEREAKERIIEFQNNLTCYCEYNITHMKSMIKETQMIIVKLEAEE